MTSQTTSIYTPFADGRPVRDIVEHTPALVNEAWCRNLLRHTLDSLEQQYASGAPHRAITPDTLVMLANGEALLLPSIDESAPKSPTLPDDLHALAMVVHYAITAELPPDGPLGPRLYDNYSEQLTKGLDCCLGPNRRLRPNTVDEMRTLLGIEAGAAEVLPVPAAEPPSAPDAQAAAPDEPATFREADTAAETDFAASPVMPAPAGNPIPEPLATSHMDRAPALDELPLPESAASPMLRKPASQDGEAQAARTPERVVPPSFHKDTGPIPAPPLKPSAADAGQPPQGGLQQSWTTTERSSRAQRWGMLAGAAIVVLAAGSALVSYMQQDDTRDLVPLSLPPAERAANGLDNGDTVLAPPSASAPADGAAAPPAGEAVEVTGAATADTPADPGAVATPALDARSAGKNGVAVVNGTTYKLVIKPWGTVYVDGVDRGVSPPVKRLTLAPGQHTIRIVNPSFAEHTMTVDAGSKETMIIEHDFTAKAE